MVQVAAPCVLTKNVKGETPESIAKKRKVATRAVAEKGPLIRTAIERSRAPEAIWKDAGFDALDSGRDVRKLGGQGIRLKDATFDPAKADLFDIMASARLHGGRSHG